MSVRVRRNFKLVGSSLVDKGIMGEVGKLVLRMVRTRTQSGTDADGAPFQPLSSGYAAQKRKAVGSSKANLVLSGRMLNDMRVIRATGHSVSVGFTGGIASGGGSGTLIQRSRGVNGAAKAHYHANVGAGASRIKRDFLGLTRDEVTEIERVVGRAVDRKLRKRT